MGKEATVPEGWRVLAGLGSGGSVVRDFNLIEVEDMADQRLEQAAWIKEMNGDLAEEARELTLEERFSRLEKDNAKLRTQIEQLSSKLDRVRQVLLDEI